MGYTWNFVWNKNNQDTKSIITGGNRACMALLTFFYLMRHLLRLRDIIQTESANESPWACDPHLVSYP
jgi:hypothetical protein